MMHERLFLVHLFCLSKYTVAYKSVLFYNCYKLEFQIWNLKCLEKSIHILERIPSELKINLICKYLKTQFATSSYMSMCFGINKIEDERIIKDILARLKLESE